jgi:lipid-A-disaccharide synthase
VAKTIYFVAGEASGDNHGAALMRSLRLLRPDLHFVGRGGPHMKVLADKQFADWTDEAGVVGLWEVIKNYGYFREKFRETQDEIEKSKPDAIVLIDYPGFNLRLAEALRRQSTTKIIYYISPQVWAWNRGRIKKMARYLDLMLCIFPFEAELYNQSGLRTVFVGHPVVERWRGHNVNKQRDVNLIALLPGSRQREVRKIFPVMLQAADYIRQRDLNVRFEVAAASAAMADELQRLLASSRIKGSFQIITGEAPDLMQRAFAGIVASGSATLEAAFFRMPFVLVYKVSWLTYLAARMVVKVKYLGMPNVLAGRIIVPEFIQNRAQPRLIADAALNLKISPDARAQMIRDFDSIITQLGDANASATAAQAIAKEISA